MKKQLLLLNIFFSILILHAQSGPKFIAMMSNGGNGYSNGNGTIIQYTNGAANISAVANLFSGANPQSATLTGAPNGKYYGLITYSSGIGPVVLEYDPSLNSYALEGNAPVVTNGFVSITGRNPYGSLLEVV